MLRRTEKNTGYLLLHRSGAVAKTKTLTVSEPIEGITAIINLETLEQFNGESWEKIPDGYEVLINAENEDVAYEYEEDDEDSEDDCQGFQVGSKRYINPHLIWAYCKRKI